MYMLLPFVFVVINFLAILLNFVSMKLSISYFWILFVATVMFAFIISIMERRRISQQCFDYYKFLLVLGLFFLLSFSVNFIEYSDCYLYLIYSYVMPFLLFFVPTFVLCSGNCTQIGRCLDKYERIFGIIWIVDLLISICEYILISKYPVLSYLFYSNDRMNSIVFSSLGVVRIPGIFNSGGANGFFILVGLVILHDKLRGFKGGVLKVLSFVVILLTFTRKIYLLFFVYLLIVFGFKLLRSNRRVLLFFNYFVLFSFVSFVFLLFFFVYLNPEKIFYGIFSNESLYSRLSEWGEVLTRFFSLDVLHILLGTGILQSLLEMYNPYGFPLYIDNMWLSIMVYGGVLFLFLCLILYFFLIYFFLKRLVLSTYKVDESFALKAYVIMVLLLIHGFFSVTWSTYEVTIYVYPYLAMIYSLLKLNEKRRMKV